MVTENTCEMAPACHLARLARTGCTEAFITVRALPDRAPEEMFERLNACLRDQAGARIVREGIFGLGRAALEAAPSADWPVTCVAEGGDGAFPLAGVQIQAVAGAPVRSLRMDGRVVGSVFEDAEARYALLGGLGPRDPALARAVQARQTFEMMEAALRLAGMDFSHVVRTWLFLDEILAWYRELNQARDAFFTSRGVYDGLVPASTGIGARNPAGTAVVAELLAVQPKSSRVRIRSVPSPLQCPALQYHSSFSRAVEVAQPDHRRLFISGTASIGPDGRSAHAGDVDAQVALTMKVVAAILESRGMDWADVSRAIAYFKHARDAAALERYCVARGLPPLPVVLTQQDICRDELLFEIELDAVRQE